MIGMPSVFSYARANLLSSKRENLGRIYRGLEGRSFVRYWVLFCLISYVLTLTVQTRSVAYSSNPQLNAYVVCQVRDKLSFYSSVLNYIVFRYRLRDRLQRLRESEAANRGEDGSGAQH